MGINPTPVPLNDPPTATTTGPGEGSHCETVGVLCVLHGPVEYRVSVEGWGWGEGGMVVSPFSSSLFPTGQPPARGPLHPGFWLLQVAKHEICKCFEQFCRHYDLQQAVLLARVKLRVTLPRHSDWVLVPVLIAASAKHRSPDLEVLACLWRTAKEREGRRGRVSGHTIAVGVGYDVLSIIGNKRRLHNPEESGRAILWERVVGQRARSQRRRGEPRDRETLDLLVLSPALWLSLPSDLGSASQHCSQEEEEEGWDEAENHVHEAAVQRPHNSIIPFSVKTFSHELHL
ncbi:hypothetical protein EYF80_000724 [Liparis tanakae]|uniref:Uncharacterized protein n=1 Tax=Liparis tanakae TaxID=230148 RepID=A0A4Z2JF15_9TELE|nr:hypothetical protein EYF80_000724 [Liparis tanakae]